MLRIRKKGRERLRIPFQSISTGCNHRVAERVAFKGACGPSDQPAQMRAKTVLCALADLGASGAAPKDIFALGDLAVLSFRHRPASGHKTRDANRIRPMRTLSVGMHSLLHLEKRIVEF